MSKKQAIEKANNEALDKAVEQAPIVTNRVDLLSAIKKGELAIISTDQELYASLLKKAPKEKVARKTKKAGTSMVALGTIITIATGGILSWLGLPIAAAGVVTGTAGLAMEEFKSYSILLDYDKKRTFFIKTKGTPHLVLPENWDTSKFIK